MSLSMQSKGAERGLARLAEEIDVDAILGKGVGHRADDVFGQLVGESDQLADEPEDGPQQARGLVGAEDLLEQTLDAAADAGQDAVEDVANLADDGPDEPRSVAEDALGVGVVIVAAEDGS